MKKHLIYALLLTFAISLVGGNVLFSQAGSKEKTGDKNSSEKKGTVTWYKYDEGLAKAKKEKKHVVVDFYTTWCGWCKRMDKYTFENEEVKKVLNESYIAVKVNAESADKVKVNGKEMTERQVAQAYGVRAYPITWFLKPTGDKIAPRSGYAEAPEFVYILNWVKDDLYDKISFDEFVKQQQEKKNSEKKD
ncbi:MAG: DUF255 domain-containing protein [Candidatus Zixiibacteriota bacterium]